MTGIAVYSKPNCVQCRMTYKKLDALNLEYTLIDITEDQGAYDYVTKTLGYQAAPVVVTEDDHWYGFNADKLNALAVNK